MNSKKKLQGNDIDILNMKAIVSIIENNLEDAEKLLWEAINLSSHHSDAFVNLAYVYEIQERTPRLLILIISLIIKRQMHTAKRN